jgi:hypothetical protein
MKPEEQPGHNKWAAEPLMNEFRKLRIQPQHPEHHRDNNSVSSEAILIISREV